jgi:hypothetical protein
MPDNRIGNNTYIRHIPVITYNAEQAGVAALRTVDVKIANDKSLPVTPGETAGKRIAYIAYRLKRANAAVGSVYIANKLVMAVYGKIRVAADFAQIVERGNGNRAQRLRGGRDQQYGDD